MNTATVDNVSSEERRLLSTPFNQIWLLLYCKYMYYPFYVLTNSYSILAIFTILGTAACSSCGLIVFNVEYGLSINVVNGITLLGTYVHYFAQLSIGNLFIIYEVLFYLTLYYIVLHRLYR